MKIGLLDVDGHNFPNLALMKISSFHKKMGDNVEFVTMFEHYDIIYKSKIFSFTSDNEYCYRADKIIEGGSGYKKFEIILDADIDKSCPDYQLYNCQHAYGFLTRGCIKNCSWCIVPKKEGIIRPYADIEDFIADKKSVILMDNNVLACEHGIRQIEKIIKLQLKVDFNQGLDARLIDKSIANLLSRVKWLKPIRLACDTTNMIPIIEKTVNLLRKHNCMPKKYFCYVLVKDIKDINDAFERCMFLKKMNVDPFAQAFIDDTHKPTRKQKDFCRWVNHKAIFKSVLWENYKK